MHELVQTIADETFAYLFATPQVPIGEANSAWLAISEEKIVGVTMTQEEWVSGFDATAAELASAKSYWRMRKVKYAVVGITHSDFGSLSRTANFRMRNSGMQC